MNQEKAIGSSTFGPQGKIEALILVELLQRDGHTETKRSKSSSDDQDIYDVLARRFGLCDEQRAEMIEVSTAGKRNRWNRSVQAAISNLRDPNRKGKQIDFSLSLLNPHLTKNGTWELTKLGKSAAEFLSENGLDHFSFDKFIRAHDA